MKLNGIFNMSFGKTYFTVESESKNDFINGKSLWTIYIDGKMYDSIEFECENLPLKKSSNNYRSFSYNGIFDKEKLDYLNTEIILKLQSNVIDKKASKPDTKGWDVFDGMEDEDIHKRK